MSNHIHYYLVGGAVRDKMLNRPIHDRDFVVVGATIDYMLANGFNKVGAAFPVFIHKKTGEEYALARTEKSTGNGYNDFECTFKPDITLEEDLARRDFTVNAMACGEHGGLIDPFNGAKDCKEKLLRCVNPDSFVEDPVRVLRAARLVCQLGDGWKVEEHTVRLCREMSASPMLCKLTPERVWKETEKALKCDKPSVYFRVLLELGALAPIFPLINALIGQIQPRQYHPEGDAFQHTMIVLDTAAKLSKSPEVRFAALMHDIGKAITPVELLPRHIGHEEKGAELIVDFCSQYRVPSSYRKAAEFSARNHGRLFNLPNMKPSKVLKLLEAPQEVVEALAIVHKADCMGRHKDNGELLISYLNGLSLFRCKEKKRITREFIKKGLKGSDLGVRLHQTELLFIKHLMK